jgi:hypothetical protein
LVLIKFLSLIFFGFRIFQQFDNVAKYIVFY